MPTRKLQLGEPVRGVGSEEESSQVAELERYFDPKLAAEVTDEQATRTTTVRWTLRQVRAIERAAAVVGMPYQTYVKDAAFRRALQDLADAERAGV
jgi:predicted DNA binding CopG/RHH family protein